ncbi:MAG TPA: transcriptional regulator [Candidatus Omnitrophota bacterium]|nr:transcriptional regulator [Candidatus Omnitrophota bacterium]HRY85487.1 transcriptional regulator [Candidatus Omnitrophota bacterium]
MKVPAAVSYHDYLIKSLKDPEEASGYLNAALEAGDKKAFFMALRNVIEARGGMTRFAKASKINRVSLYKMLSGKGNPGFLNILILLQHVGLRFQASSGKRHPGK